MYMVPTTSSNRCMFTDLLSMIGSGEVIGAHGARLGIGAIILVGGTHIVVGHMIGTGIVAIPIITIIIGAPSVPDIICATVIMICTTV